MFCTGPVLGFPVQNVCVEVTSLVIGTGTSPAFVSTCISECVSKVMYHMSSVCVSVLILSVCMCIQAMREAEVQLLEPFTQLEVRPGVDLLPCNTRIVHR